MGKVDAFIDVSSLMRDFGNYINSGDPIEKIESSTSFVATVSNMTISPATALVAADINLVAAITLIGRMEADRLENKPFNSDDALALAGHVLGAAIAFGVLAAQILPAGNALRILQLAGRMYGGFDFLKYVISNAHAGDKDNISSDVSNSFLSARGRSLRDPLAIDLDGDGIETVGIDGGVLFDHNADGLRTGTGWVKADDAFVVLDRDGNGTIDSGRELFGVDTLVGGGEDGQLVYAKDGFAALASLDSNGDRVFDAGDAAYANVQLWRDLNQDGVSQAGELQSLAAAGITAIDLNAHQAERSLSGGNIQQLIAAVAGIDGNAAALDLADNPFYRAFPDTLDTAAVADLPDMQGSGALRDLREAATLSAELEGQLRTLSTQGYVNRETFRDQVDRLVAAWADSSGFLTSADRATLTQEQLANLNAAGISVTSAGWHYKDPVYDLERAASYSYCIIYLPEGVDRELLKDANGIVSMSSGASGTGTLGTLDGTLSEAEREAQLAKWRRATYLVETLERYNNLGFINVAPVGVTDAAGRKLTDDQEPPPSDPPVIIDRVPVFIPLADVELERLEKAYAALQQSVIEALAPQTRLKGYLDGIALTVDASGIRLDFAALEGLLAERHASAPQDAYGDLVDLLCADRVATKTRRWRDGAGAVMEAANDGRWLRRAA